MNDDWEWEFHGAIFRMYVSTNRNSEGIDRLMSKQVSDLEFDGEL